MATKGLQIRVSSDSTKARADLSKLNKSVKSLDTQAQRLTKSFKQAAIGITAAFSGAAVIRGITKASDGLIGLENQLTLVVGKGKQVNNTLLALRRQSNEVGVSIGQTTTTFNRFGLSLRGKASVEQLLTTTKAINQAALISGASSESAKAAIIQLGQGLASGTLRGEELNSVLEQTPRIAQAIATGMKVPFEKLREEAKAGRITSDAVFKAILNQAKKIDDEYKTLNFTVEQFALVAKDNFSFLVAEIDRTLGVSELIRDSLEQLGLAFFKVASNWSTSIRDINSRILLFKLDVRAFVREVNQNLAGLFDVDISQAEFNRRFSSLVSQFEGLLPTIKFNFEPIVLDDYVPDLEAIKTKVGEFTTAIAGFFEKLYTAVIGNSSWPDMWYKGERSITGSLWNSAMRTGRDGVKAFTADIKGYFEKLAPKVESLWRNMWNRITTVGGEVSVDEFGELNVKQNLLGRSYDSLIAKIDEQNKKLRTQVKLWESIKGRIDRAITAASTFGGAAITDPNTGDLTGFEKNLLGRSIDDASESVGNLQNVINKLSFDKIKEQGVNSFKELKKAAAALTTTNNPITDVFTGDILDFEKNSFGSAIDLVNNLLELGKSKINFVNELANEVVTQKNIGQIIGEEFIKKLTVDQERLGAILFTAISIGSVGRAIAFKGALLYTVAELIIDTESLNNAVESASKGLGKLIGDIIGGVISEEGESSVIGASILKLISTAFEGVREGLRESLTEITVDKEFGELTTTNPFNELGLDIAAAIVTGIGAGLSANILSKILFGKGLFNLKTAFGLYFLQQGLVKGGKFANKAGGFLAASLGLPGIAATAGTTATGATAAVSAASTAGSRVRVVDPVTGGVSFKNKTTPRLGTLSKVAGGALAGFKGAKGSPGLNRLGGIGLSILFADLLFGTDEQGRFTNIIASSIDSSIKAALSVVGLDFGSGLKEAGEEEGASIFSYIFLGFGAYLAGATLTNLVSSISGAILGALKAGTLAAGKAFIAAGGLATFLPAGVFALSISISDIVFNKDTKIPEIRRGNGANTQGEGDDLVNTGTASAVNSVTDKYYLPDDPYGSPSDLGVPYNLGKIDGLKEAFEKRYLNINVNNLTVTDGELNVSTDAANAFGLPQYRRASGGPISGPGTGTSDDIPAMLSNGEYVIKASSARKFGRGFLDRINQGVNPLGFNGGGLVEDDPTFIRLLERRAALGMSLRGAAPSAVAGINEDLVALNKQIAQYAETIAKDSESAAKDSKEINNGVKTGNALTKVTQKLTKDILKSLDENALDVSRQDFLDTDFFGSGLATTSTFDSTGAFAESLKTEEVDSTLKNAFSTALGQALRTGDVKGALTGLLDTVTNKIIDNFVNGIADSLFGEGTGILGSLGNIFGGEEGESPLSGLTKDLKKSVGGLFEGLSDSLGGLFEGIGSLFSGAGGGGGGLLGGLFSIGSSLLGAFGGIGGTTGSFGLPKSFSQGGTVPSTNYSQAGVDSVPALLTPGEMVVKRSAVNNMRQQGGNNSQQVVNLNITGDISTATKKEVMKMIPQIAGGVNYTNRQNNYKG